MVAQYVIARFSLNDGEVFGQQSFQNARMYISHVGTIIILPKIAPLLVVVKEENQRIDVKFRTMVSCSLFVDIQATQATLGPQPINKRTLRTLYHKRNTKHLHKPTLLDPEPLRVIGE